MAGGGDFFTAHAVPGNAIFPLPDGGWIDKARQQLIGQANRSISISAFAWEDDDAGRGFLGLLTGRAKAGIDVRIIADHFGARAIQKYTLPLLADGVRTIFFNPGTLWYPEHWIMGMHEKLLIVDGQYVVLGGSGWADPYRVSGRDSQVWYDLDVRIDGPAAGWFHDRYNELWRRAAQLDRASEMPPALTGPPVGSDDSDDDGAAARAGEDAFEARYALSRLYPSAAVPMGTAAVLPLHGNPLFTSERPILDTYLAAIAATSNGGRIRLYSPYCVPVPAFIDALLAARKRGVTVDILTNSLDSTDGGAVLMAGMYEATAPLRAAGVGVHEWPKKSLMHRKGGVFDDRWAYFGSDNLDRRGSEKQTESVAFTDDAKTVATLARAMDEDLALAGPPITEQFVARDLERIGAAAQVAAHATLNELAGTISSS